jgi:YidC/Oxa1 family membrane protein insertase
MDVRRISLIAGLAIMSYIMILQWSKDYPSTAVVSNETIAAVESGTSVVSEVPQGNTSSTVTTEDTVSTSFDLISVNTDTFHVEINLNGGDITLASLPKYPNSLETPDIPFKLLETEARTYIAQSGLVGENGIDQDGRAIYTSSQQEYVMSESEDSLEVILNYQADNGLSVNKIFSFTRNSYVIDIRFEIVNGSTETLRTNLFAQLKRDASKDNRGIGKRSYLGTTFSTAEHAYEKVSFKDLDDDNFTESSVGGWVAIIQHYFLTAWVPPANDQNNFYGQKGSSGYYYAGYQSPTITIGPGEEATIGSQLYVGPKDQEALAAIADNLEKTVDFGLLWWVAQPLFWLLKFIHGIVGNWGWSIVLLTLTVKICLYPLTASSYRSMAKMKKFTPKIQELKEQFGDDRQRMSQEMMKLYQKEKLNPLGGCLPMLLQMPVFIALYWTLMESVELRQSPFIFWIVDLSVKDPFFVLPLLMGASMFFQMQMQQQPTMDPMQAKIMKFMPVMFTFMFLWFPAGLTLYWLSNNLITITQQFIVNKSIERAEAKASH